MNTALKLAVETAGSQGAFARLIGTSQPRVWYWLHKGKPLPAEYVLVTEEKIGISRHVLRPDLYPRDNG
jgi:DNA-binding transcriptional regulator YdaS (Cro superfamily)